MQIAVVGTNARAVARAAGVRAEILSTLRAAAGHTWTLLALTGDASRVDPRQSIAARTLLLPGDASPALAAGIGARQVVCCGFSPKDTLTLSSLTPGERMLCLQRSVRALDGRIIEPQELLLPHALNALSEEDALLAAGLRLLTGML